MRGRVFDVTVSKSGTRIAAVSALDGQGELAIYSYEFDTALPDDIKKINEKRVQQRNAAEQTKLDEYRTKNISRITQILLDQAALYAVAFSPDGKTVAAAGGDGVVRIVETETGKIVKEFSPAPLTEASKVAQAFKPAAPLSINDTPSGEALPAGAKIEAVTVEPSAVMLTDEFSYNQLVIAAKLSSGEVVDVSRTAKLTSSAPVITTRPLDSSVPRRTARPNSSSTLPVTSVRSRSLYPVSARNMSQTSSATWLRSCRDSGATQERATAR